MFCYTIHMTATVLITAEDDEEMWNKIGDMFHETDGGEIVKENYNVGVAPIVDMAEI